MKAMIVSLFAMWMAVSLCGCETVKGVGRDIESASSSVQKAIAPKGGGR